MFFNCQLCQVEDILFVHTAGLENYGKTLISVGFLIHILLLHLKAFAYTKWLLLKTKLLRVMAISGFLF